MNQICSVRSPGSRKLAVFPVAVQSPLPVTTSYHKLSILSGYWDFYELLDRRTYCYSFGGNWESGTMFHLVFYSFSLFGECGSRLDCYNNNNNNS